MSFGPSIFSNYSPAEADWGIEEYLPRGRFNSVTGSDFSHLRLREQPRISSLGHSEYQESLRGSPALAATTENFHKYIDKYLSVKSLRDLILDKFKYNLVVSNLLDESLVLSKNEQALTNLRRLQNEEKDSSFIESYGDEFLLLRVFLKLYKLVSSQSLSNPCVLLNTISMMIFLFKQNFKLSSQLSHNTKIRLFRFLLIVSTKIIQHKRIWAAIEASKTLRNLDEFMITSCQINKAIITNVLSIKEFDMFACLNRPEALTILAPPQEYSSDLKSHLNTILDNLMINFKFSIRELLPFSNGEILEKYCEINNIPLGTITQLPMQPEDLNLEYLTSKLSAFNGLRRFFVCQLLTIHDPHSHNFFILKLCDHFNVSLEKFPKFISSSCKMRALCKIFSEQISTAKRLLAHNTQFKALQSVNQTVDFVNDDILSTNTDGRSGKFQEDYSFNDSDLPLSQLIDKLQNLTTSLKYFKKYKNSIANNSSAEEHEEKISIFELFGSELKGMMSVYQSCMNDLSHEFTLKFQGDTSPSTRSSSNRNSANHEQFNPKVFHTSSRSSRRHVSQPGTLTELDLINCPDKRLKRLSVGLQLGLLTVLEEPNKKLGTGEVSRHQSEASLRIQLPLLNEAYNARAFDALTRKQDIKSNRYSMYSLNSNVSGISDLIASTNLTTENGSPDVSRFNEENSDHMSKSQLKERLEESYSRMFSGDTRHHSGDVDKNEGNMHFREEAADSNDYYSSGITQNKEFLTDLENTLATKTSSP
ncbi:hypothetical protein PUMCH_005056 [Australozyma saopauloensis]|uniref:Myosin-binding domain-containing protein n=1 Tax=Australozyma saopauloensis TaxID=291208 RepID=A0AAX4HGA6_9ASCO|nr:hypothetical protein PUMCH_005056 [[Candida] saopauloensis]